MKNILDRIEFQLYRTRWIFIVALMFLMMFFHVRIEKWLTLKIVIPYLAFINHRYVIDFFFIGVAIVIFLIGFNRLRRGYLVSDVNCMIYLIIVAVFCYYRNYSDVWQFESFETLPFYYLDVLYFPFIIGILLKIFSFPGVQKVYKRVLRYFSKIPDGLAATPFILDEPLPANGIDDLNRREAANSLAKKILITTSERSIAIGINGEWGTGKTSFIRMMKDELQKTRQCVIVDFNPWRGYKENALYNDFFSTLSEEVGKHGDILRTDLKKYGDTLTSSKESTIESIVSLGTNLLNVDSAEGQHREINEILKKLNKNFVVFVDDIDRLSAQEVAAVIKLVRNTADFYNVKFVLAYDRNYLLSALKLLNEYSYATYLEKVILYEHTLLPISDVDIRKSLSKFFTEYIRPEAQEEFKKVLLTENFKRGTHILRFIFTLRDVKRFCNRIIPLYNLRYREVDVIDFVNFELLRFHFPVIIKLLANRRNEFLQTHEGISSLQKEDSKIGGYVFLNYLEANLQYYKIESAYKNSLFNLLNALFVIDGIMSSRASDKSIRQEKNFEAYFRESKLENAISHQEFEELLLLPLNELNVQLVELVSQGKRVSVVEKFSNFNAPKNCLEVNQFEKIIRAIFFLGNIPVKSGEEWYGYPDKDIFSKLADTKFIAKKFYNGDEKLFHRFIIDVLNSAQFPYFNESGFLSYLSANSFSEDFIINQDEIEMFLLNYFRKYCAKQEKFESHFWRLYRNCVKRKMVTDTTSQKVPIEGANSIHIDFVFKNSNILKEYLSAVIGKEPREGLYCINEVTQEVFGSFQAFADKLIESNFREQSFVKEFLTFHDTFKASGYKVYVPFKFTYLT